MGKYETINDVDDEFLLGICFSINKTELITTNPFTYKDGTYNALAGLLLLVNLPETPDQVTNIFLFPATISWIFINDSATWLTARTYALILNMIFRSLEITYLYSPSKSYVTNSLIHDKNFRNMWGQFNCALTFCLTLPKINRNFHT